MPQGSRIFTPNRSLGYVSNHIPLQVRYIKSRKENLITTCTGKSFHTYGISHFTLLSVSGLHSEDIACMTADAYHIYTVCNDIIYAWRRGTELKHQYKGHKHPIHLMIPFGAHLISIDESSCVKIWDIKQESVHLELTFNNNTFKITTVVHPSTYLNKILFGSEQGTMQLWNIKTSKLVYTFDKNWKTQITVLVQAPAIDVVAIGLSSGKIILHNLKFDETVMEFQQDWGLVTSISFRTDGYPIMATGSVTGHIVFWNLEERKVANQLLCAHDAAVTGMQCLSNEPLMLTSSPDNTLKLWIFDMVDDGARLLRIREGHSATPCHIRYHGSDGNNILSSSADSTLRIFNTKTEIFNKSLGKASYNRKVSKKHKRTSEDPLKMPPIIQFTSETTREKEWDNIAAIHLGLPMVTTWSYDKVKMGDLKLLPERLHKKNRDPGSNVIATCLCLSNCGNFVIVGYSSGHVDRFNIQSGICRDSYGENKAHDRSVRGVCADALNRLVVTGSSDRSVKFWNFKCSGRKHITKLLIEEPVNFFCAHREGSLIAAALDDFRLVIIDMDTRAIVRQFLGHTAQLTDAAFSPDSRWIVSAAMDCSIRTWDIPNAQLIDQFCTPTACTSLTMSPTGEILASAHVDCLGLFLWCNKSLYEHITLKALDPEEEPPLITLPTYQSDLHDIEEVRSDSETDDDEFKSPEQISKELITLSTLPTSRWQNLLKLDIIRQRNKPKAPPKAPKSAPFFLPTLPSLTFQFDLSSDQPSSEDSKLLKLDTVSNLSSFGKALQETTASEDFPCIVDRLKNLGPSMIEFEIKSLSLEEGGSLEVMLQFMKLLNFMFSSKKDFELAQAYLGVFLKLHGSLIANEDCLREYLPILQKCQADFWKKLQDKLLYNLCVVQTVKTM